MHSSKYLRFVFVAMLFALGCKPTLPENVIGKYVTDSLVYRQQIILLKDGTYQHTVFQMTGNSVSTREDFWSFERLGGETQVILNEFKPVVTHKDFAVHRVWGLKFDHMTFNARNGFFDSVILTSVSDPPVEYVSVE